MWQGIPKELASCNKAGPEGSEERILVLTFLLCLQSMLKKACPLGFLRVATTGTCTWSHLYFGPGFLHFVGSAPHPVVTNHTHCGCGLSPVGILHGVS